MNKLLIIKGWQPHGENLVEEAKEPDGFLSSDSKNQYSTFSRVLDTISGVYNRNGMSLVGTIVVLLPIDM
jgi:hypothetical protein